MRRIPSVRSRTREHLPHSEPEGPTSPDRLAGVGANLLEALEAACEEAAGATEAPGAAIRLREGQQLVCWACAGTMEHLLHEGVPIATSIEGLAMRTGQLVLCDDAWTDTRADPRTSRQLSVRSWLVLPLAHEGRTIATLSVSSPEPDVFSASPARAGDCAQALRAIGSRLHGHLQNAAWIVEREDARAELEEQTHQMQILSEMMTEGVLLFDRNGRFQYANNAAARLLGLTFDQVAARHVRDALWTLVREDGSPWPGAEQPAAVTLETGASFRDVVMGVKKPQGMLNWVSVSTRIVPDQTGAPAGVIVVLADCTERHGIRERLSHATLYDELTGLPNGRLLRLELDDAIDRARRQGLAAALVPVRLAGFRALKAELGAHNADRVLCGVAERLQRTMRDGDIIARPSDEDFVALLGMLGEPDRAVSAFVARVQAQLAEPVVLDTTPVPVSAEFGGSVYPQDGRTSDALMRHAQATITAPREEAA